MPEREEERSGIFDVKKNQTNNQTVKKKIYLF